MSEQEIVKDPIFIGGDGRSGTTLLNVILDSHPTLSVAPEYHFNGGSDLGSTALEAVRIKKDGGLLESGIRAVDTPEWKPAMQFVNRVVRAGLSLDEIHEAIQQAMEETGTNLVEFHDRCRLIEKFGMILVNRDSKKRWGMKIMREIRNPKRYANVWGMHNLFISSGMVEMWPLLSCWNMVLGVMGTLGRQRKIGAISSPNLEQIHQIYHIQK